MRIKTFCKFIEMSELEPLVLRDNTVVIDGQNYFWESYHDSGLPQAFGCESHLYANFLREHLAMFKKANVKCYFLFKGAYGNMDIKLQKDPTFQCRFPIYMKNIYKEVLDEMGFEYVTCEYESKRDIIALAQRLECPVISFNIEFCFAGVRYIPRIELKFNELDNNIDCRYFSLEKFSEKYKLTAVNIAIFIVLTDENIYPEDFFLDFFKHIKIKSPKNKYLRNSDLLRWLAGKSRENILNTVFQFITADDKKKFKEEVAKTELVVYRQETGGLAAAFLLDRSAAAVAPADPEWFIKGIATNKIAINYINLYRNRYFFGSRGVIPQSYQDDAVFMSLDVVKYAYDLLTNFQNEGFLFVYETTSENQTVTISEAHSIQKPDYVADVCVFENGWSELRELGLFEHFLRESLQLVDLLILEKLPEDARLLVIALVYFSRKKQVNTNAEVACVLISYVTLSVVLDKCDKNNLPKLPFASRPILDSTTDKNAVTDVDCNTAAAILADYLSISERAAENIPDQKLLDPLEEFQYCLWQLNDLNTLCGAPFAPTVFNRTYAGSLVYWLRYTMADAADTQKFLDTLLSPAPTVYAFLNGLIDATEEL